MPEAGPVPPRLSTRTCPASVTGHAGGTGSEENLCSNRLMMEEPQKWREPRRDGFDARSVWSLFNAFTESLKDETLPS